MKITNNTPSPVYLKSKVGTVPIGCLFVLEEFNKVYMRIRDSIEIDDARAVCMASGEVVYLNSDTIVTHADGELIYRLTEDKTVTF